MSELSIEPIPAFSDNYIWLISNPEGDAFVVDPGDDAPVAKVLAERGLTLRGVLVTHWHPDHIGGVPALKSQTQCTVWAPASEHIPCADVTVAEGDSVDVLGQAFEVLSVPGHTLDHIAYFREGSLFCGDTLFVTGCGRVFEGTPTMMRNSLKKIRDLPDNTKIYCAHEYTLNNLAFATHVEPEHEGLASLKQRCKDRRAQGEPTVPATLGDEKATNPFLRWDDPALAGALQVQGRLDNTDPDGVFAAVRAWKDSF